MGAQTDLETTNHTDRTNGEAVVSQPDSYYYLCESHSLAQILAAAQHKSRQPQELYLTQRRRAAGVGNPFRPRLLCASASLREIVLVAAERSEAALGDSCNSWFKQTSVVRRIILRPSFFNLRNLSNLWTHSSWRTGPCDNPAPVNRTLLRTGQFNSFLSADFTGSTDYSSVARYLTLPRGVLESSSAYIRKCTGPL